MTVEVIDLTIVDALPEAESLETYLLAVLERHDGLCLDNEPERLQLATALAAAFISAIRHGTANASIIAGEAGEARRRPGSELVPVAMAIRQRHC